MNFIGNRNFRAGPQTSLEGFICPQNSDKQQKIKVFGRSGGGTIIHFESHLSYYFYRPTMIFIIVFQHISIVR